MLFRAFILRLLHCIVICLSVLFAGCHRPSPPPPPTIAELHFPVVVLFGTSAATVYRDASALGTMQIGHLNALTNPPPLIDSQFTIYRLNKLSSTHNGLWLMAHPTGSTEVKFELERSTPSGPDAARTLLLRRLDTQTWRTDLDERRRVLALQQTLPGMLVVIQEEER